MKIPDRNFSVEEFHNYLIEQFDEAFEKDERKRWLKVYCVLVQENNWQDVLFTSDELEKRGDIYKASLKASNTTKEDNYAIVEYVPGLLLFYTTATDEKYRKELGDRIKKGIGTARMWIKPDLFSIFWKGILEKTGGYVKRFMSKKGALDNVSCKIRPLCARRFNYTGKDAGFTLDELKELYGVTPESLYLRTPRNYIRITNDGLFSVQKPSPEILEIFFGQLDRIKDKILKIMETSKQIKFKFVEEGAHLRFPSFEAGLDFIRSWP